MASLRQILMQRIQNQGPISFAQFMDLALYCPNLGYYEKNSDRIGRSGDFYTSVSTGPFFGQLLGFQFAQWMEQISAPCLNLVEAGAHQGDLAQDLLRYLGRYHPALYDRCQYLILEPSPVRQAWQQAALGEFHGKIRWVQAVDALPEGSLNGIIFSNEFLDSWPVHRLGWDAAAQDWFEWGVDFQEPEGFAWVRLPGQPGAWNEALDRCGLDWPPAARALLPDGFTLELCPAALQWWSAAAARLAQGWLLTIDYGWEAEDYYHPSRLHGSLRAYARHQQCPNVLADPGDQDLTAHVNFSGLTRAGLQAGLVTQQFQTQERFLTRVLQNAWETQASFLQDHAGWLSQFRSLTHPQHLGQSFRILVQHRPGPRSVMPQPADSTHN